MSRVGACRDSCSRRSKSTGDLIEAVTDDTEKKIQEYVRQALPLFESARPEYDAMWCEIAGNFYGSDRELVTRGTFEKTFDHMVKSKVCRWFRIWRR